MKAQKKTKNTPEQAKKARSHKNHFLVLYNDDEHSIDYVVNSLITICGHNPEQALQCTLIIHNMKSYEVKKGSLSFLKPMKKAFTAKQLKSTIK